MTQDYNYSVISGCYLSVIEVSTAWE